MKKVVIAVTNDLFSDRRVGRVATTLHGAGYKVILIGRKLKNSPPVTRGYKTIRYRLLFNRSFLFYASYNTVIFFDLLFRSYDIVLANDLDTLPACHLAAWFRRKKVVFDSHELFPEVPELAGRPFVKKVWQKLERMFVKRQKYSYTVCGSISEYYKEKYGITCEVVRNVPVTQNVNVNSDEVPDFNHPLIVYQGALNKGRGIERVIEALSFLKNVYFLIIGTGDIDDMLTEYSKSKGVAERIIFTGRISPGKLATYTAKADLGVSLEENIGMNYYYALPNKLFDYIHAEVPVLVSAFPEMKRVVETYNIGCCASETDAEKLAGIISSMLSSPDYKTWKTNTIIAREELCWEKESIRLLEIFGRIQ